MKKRFLFTYVLIMIGFIMLSVLINDAHAANKTAANPQTSGMQQELAVMNKKLDALMQGQAKLSEEHKQLRYWINKRR